MINDALESLVQAVKTERADVIQSVVKTVQKCKCLLVNYIEYSIFIGLWLYINPAFNPIVYKATV